MGGNVITSKATETTKSRHILSCRLIICQIRQRLDKLLADGNGMRGDLMQKALNYRGVSTLEYFKEFFKAIMQGRTDYENMLPMTIGIKK